MALSARLTGRTAPVASAAGLSKARGGTLTLSVTGIDDARDAWLAIGAAGGAPATYSDIGNDVGGVLPFGDASSSVKFNASDGTYAAGVSFEPSMFGFNEGDSIYLAVFLSNGASAPDAAAVPDAVAGPIAVVA